MTFSCLRSAAISRSVLTCLAVMLGVLSAPSAKAQCNGRWLTTSEWPGVNEAVLAATSWDPDGPGPQPSRLVIGGRFRFSGGRILSNIAMWDGSAWQPLGEGLDNEVRALTVFRGELIAGGVFFKSGSTNVERIARWDGTSWKPLGVGAPYGANHVVGSLLVVGDELIAGGSFTSVMGVPAARIARWDGAAWHAIGGGFDGEVGANVAALEVYGGRLIAAGNFLSAEGQPVSQVAAWDGSSWKGLGSGITGPHISSRVSGLTVFDGELIATGWFDAAGGVPANHIARWDGSTWRPMGSGLSFPAETVAVYHDELVVGGQFATAGGVAAASIARWDGSIWRPVGAGVATSPVGPAVLALAIHDGELIVGGQFTLAGSTAAGRVARWDGEAWRSVGAGKVAPATALGVYNGELIAGGSFAIADDAGPNNIAAWTGRTWLPLPGGPSATVGVIQQAGEDLFVGGSFESLVDDRQVNRIARWDGEAWHALASGVNGTVRAITAHEGDLIAGGDFTAGGASENLNHVGRWNGSTWEALGSGTDFKVAALAVYDGELIAAGSNTIARWDGVAWVSFGPDVPGTVTSLTAIDGVLVAGGNLIVGGRTQYALQWDGVAWSSMALDSLAPLPSTWPTIATIHHNRLVLAGDFQLLSTAPWSPALWWTNSGWSSGGVEGPSSRVTGIATAHDELVADGPFGSAGGLTTHYFARWADRPAPWIAIQPEGSAAPAGGDIALSAAPALGYDFAGPLSFQWRRDGVPITNGLGGASASGGVVTGASGTISGMQSAALRITGIRPSDAGSYDCLISNGCGTAVSEPAVVTVSGGCPADLVVDGVVDFTDYLEFLNLFEALDPRADFVLDGVIDFSDYLEYLNHFDAGC